MKSIKYILAVFTFIMFSCQLFSQQRTEMKAYYDSKNVIINEDGRSVSNFKIVADEIQVSDLKEKAKNFQSIFILVIDEGKDEEGKYGCKITFLQPAESTFLIKMLGGLGIYKIVAGNEEYSLNDFIINKK
jgi:hypothetical protein